jgi:hypothetical protein
LEVVEVIERGLLTAVDEGLSQPEKVSLERTHDLETLLGGGDAG